MSGHKYADLPDIDTAPDIYETEDAFSTVKSADHSSDEDSAFPIRGNPGAHNRAGVANAKEGLDTSHLVKPDETMQRFRQAERKSEHNARIRTRYMYPPPRSSSSSPTFLDTHRQHSNKNQPLSRRLREIQADLTALEAELADPANPLLQREEGGPDPGGLLRGLVEVRGRLEKVRKGKEGRGRLVEVLLQGEGSSIAEVCGDAEIRQGAVVGAHDGRHKVVQGPGVGSVVVGLDKRVEELERLIGSSTALDEMTPLPAPLLPLITRLNMQMTLLTQPRHLDSITRRLKLLLSDLERASGAQGHTHQHHVSQNHSNVGQSISSTIGSSSGGTQLQEQIMPLITRLSTSLPHIPHILARLRTLAALHTSASDAQSSLDVLEQEQQRTHMALVDLERAVGEVERNLVENRAIVERNVVSLEARVEALVARVDGMD